MSNPSAPTIHSYFAAPQRRKRRPRLRCFVRAVATLSVAGLCALPAHAQNLCSGGANDGQACVTIDGCPGGACVVAQGICDGGSDDGLDCDCPGDTCVSMPACSTDALSGTCGGGLFSGECCDVDFNCSDGSPCAATRKVCLSGDLKGFSCLRDMHCNGAPCGVTGKVCGDGFACVDDQDCVVGNCTGPGVGPTPTGSPSTPTPSSTPAPFATPTSSPPTGTPGSATPTPPRCIGDCDGNGEVTVDNLLLMVNISLGNIALDQCLAGDADGDGEITVDEIISAVNVSLTSCA
ncbi:MAG: hypothetical protein HY270_10140 [Deltaproteobacteria bacterium]|nr:hypothetical protein [Deltaproteobacteria bacterium]